MKITVAVLLASYNGIKYIKEQIESILSQKTVNVSIFVSDDFSTDNTLEYLKKIYKEEKRLFFLESKKKFDGAAKNFYRLIKDVNFANFDYVALADQDDVWCEDKVIRAINIIEEKSVDGYSGNVLAFWESGKKKLINKAQKQAKFDYLFEAAGPGCTYVLKKELALDFQSFLKSNFDKVQCIALHDWLIYAFSRSNGYKWFIDSAPKMKYRQHGNNQVGVNNGFKAKSKRIGLVFSSWYRNETQNIMEILELEDKYKFSNLIFNKSYFSNLRLLKYVFFFRRRFIDRIAFLILLITGIY